MKKTHSSVTESGPRGRDGLGKNEAELVALLGRSLDGLLVVDRAGRILEVNEAACRITGYDIGELRTMSFEELAARGDGGHGPAELFGRIAEVGSGRCDCRLRTKGGAKCDVEVGASSASDDGVILCFLRDVTARNREQAAAVDHARELAQAAEAANRAKSAFLASMTHELRTPLNVINGLAATMAEQSTDVHEVHSAQLILESGQSLLAIIEELLDFSGLQAGKARLEPRAFDLLGLVTQTVRQVSVMARRKGLFFNYRVRAAVPARVVGDPRRIQQVLLNLLANAVNYTVRGGIYLDVGGVDHDGRWRLVFTVADTGVGIASVDVSKLFQPFSRAEFGQTRQVHGTGLGLSIARSFAQLMGGDIVVRSRPGKGTVFRCSIEADETDGGPAIGSLAPAGAGGRRVLVVCSDRPTRRMLTDALRLWGLVPVVWDGPDSSLPGADLEAGVDLAVVEAAVARNLSAMLNRHLQTRPGGRVVPVVWLTCADRQWPVPATARATNVALPIDLAELARGVVGLLAPAAEESRPEEGERKLGERLPLRLLVADDIPTNREMLRRLLAHLGYKAQLAVNGAEAVEAARLQPFDLILLDVEMPVMNGLAAAREIVRQQPDPARRPKIVALTANALSGDRERCLAAGMDEYLSKPVLPSHIEACFLKLFRDQAPQAPVATVKSADLDLVDRAQLAAMFPGLPGPQVAEVLRQLKASAERDLESAWPRLGEACANRNCAHLVDTAHGLKGCFTMLGWARLAAYCDAAISEARAGSFSGWATFGPGLQRLYDLSIAEMDCFLEELTEAGSEPLAAPGSGR